MKTLRMACDNLRHIKQEEKMSVSQIGPYIWICDPSGRRFYGEFANAEEAYNWAKAHGY